ncbi:MBL fold metallo-hydrolase [Paenibacillus ginsengarvi]|uniref:MBL fold metallo-hydrolase n=1 Tax=Paenibacillus ginsengarvi TaxID=400777 RepID=A0A3B0CBF1_9BACL|nr:MBL fold metallo-hydrolase [Paenibacillus ginsengarvi]RKN81978.1 MBL fold metallo-hydrolase [Paenibacillus ginsengarvi]
MATRNNPERTPERLMEEIRGTRLPIGCIAVWFFGQESMVIKGKETVIHIDPFYSNYLEVRGVKRVYPPLLKPESITVADLCLVTHEHEDHLDPWTLKVIAKQCPKARFMAPLSCRPELETSCEMKPEQIIDALTGEWLELDGNNGEQIRVKPIPAAHESIETTGNERAHRYVGYLLDINGVKVYHAGDTIVYPGLPELLAEEGIDLGMLPINGRDYFRTSRGIVGNMNIREAAELAKISHMDMVVPLHYDLFAGNSEKPGNFVQELYERYPEQKCHVMARGERFVYASPWSFLTE